jgi:iron complex outermembrane recepter protein
VFGENWKDFQLSFLGPSSVTEIANAGQAKITGVETEIDFAASRTLTVSGGFSITEPKLSQDYCGVLSDTSCPDPLAPKEEQLPTTAEVQGQCHCALYL